MYPALARSYKGIFAFKLGTTSFIYPDHYIPNVKMLGPYLDEIELLLFESLPGDALPSKAIIAELSHLAREYGLTYNIHLPTDVSISDEKPEKQQHAVNTVLSVIDKVSPLAPTAYALHIPYNKKSFDNDTVKSWQSRVFKNLGKILAGGIPAESIAVETLDYRFDLLNDILAELNLRVCLDIGHLIAHGYDLNALFKKYFDITSIIHLHGVKNGHDHLALDKLPDKFIEPVLALLKRFTGSVSLEVFSFDDLKPSLEFLEKRLRTAGRKAIAD
ncbi:MAG: TIM barrel protein [Desulfobacterales bacterium]|nr:TIM barrel protein [Desulfobacterales bacterium]